MGKKWHMKNLLLISCPFVFMYQYLSWWEKKDTNNHVLLTFISSWIIQYYFLRLNETSWFHCFIITMKHDFIYLSSWNLHHAPTPSHTFFKATQKKFEPSMCWLYCHIYIYIYHILHHHISTIYHQTTRLRNTKLETKSQSIVLQTWRKRRTKIGWVVPVRFSIKRNVTLLRLLLRLEAAR